MLYRMVRPMKRQGSRYLWFVRRIPADIKARAVGMTLALPVGENTVPIKITSAMQSERCSLRSAVFAPL